MLARLFIFSFLVLSPFNTAFALDYAKCEAMERARDRAMEDPLLTLIYRNARLQALNNALDQGRRELSAEEIVETTIATTEQIAKGLKGDVAKEKMQKIQKINLDIKKEKCP